MGIEAVALLHVPLDRVREVLPAVDAAPGTYRGLAGQRLELRAVADATLVRTRAPFGAEPEELGQLLGAALGPLLDEHGDPRGIFVYPDVAKPKTTTYDAIVDEFGEAGFWVPCLEPAALGQGPAGLTPDALEATMRQLVGGLPPGALAQMQQALTQTDPSTLARAAAELEGALAGNSGDLMGVLQRTMAQARDMLVAQGMVGAAGGQAADDGQGTESQEAGTSPPLVPDEAQAPALWRQARAHVEAMRDKNPEQWQQFEKQIEQLAGAVPGATPPATAGPSPIGRPADPGRSTKRKHR
jgi:hypothetical protein